MAWVFLVSRPNADQILAQAVLAYILERLAAARFRGIPWIPGPTSTGLLAAVWVRAAPDALLSDELL